jgi:hypothetical protein
LMVCVDEIYVYSSGLEIFSRGGSGYDGSASVTPNSVEE